MTPPKVLLLGGHGKVALHLTPLLLARNWNVTSVIRNPEHENEILALQKQHKGKLSVLISSLDDVKSDDDAKAVLDKVRPDYVVWSAGAGGKGGPARTKQIDEIAAKHYIAASFADSKVRKFLLVSHLGSRRNKPSWLSDEEWKYLVHINTDVLPAYAKAKLEADEYLTALAAKKRKTDPGFQAILLRPGYLSDGPGTGKVELGKTRAKGNVPREDVARVADELLARDNTRGWADLLGGEENIEDAIDRVVKDKIDVVEGEDVEGMIKRFSL